MKKFIFLSTILICFGLFAKAQKSTIIQETLQKSAIEKVVFMQNLINFNDEQAKKIAEIEYLYLLDVQKAENCCFCNTSKKIEKLKQEKSGAVEKILSRDEFVKYNLIEAKKIKKYPLWAE
ncbi:MAG: hypothetical protein ACK5L7_05370 [Paludibacteraceae bacterium]